MPNIRLELVKNNVYMGTLKGCVGSLLLTCACAHVHVCERQVRSHLFVQDVEGMSPEHILTDAAAPPTQVCRSHI